MKESDLNYSTTSAEPIHTNCAFLFLAMHTFCASHQPHPMDALLAAIDRVSPDALSTAPALRKASHAAAPSGSAKRRKSRSPDC